MCLAQSPEARVWAKVAGAWPGAVFVRRSAFVQVGGFDSDIGDLTLATVDLALRMRREHTDARSAPPALVGVIMRVCRSARCMAR